MQTWSYAKAALKMFDVYQKLADKTDEDFVSRKFTAITVDGEMRYQSSDLMAWEDAQGNLAFIDYNCRCIGVFYAGIAYAIHVKMQTTCPCS